MNTSSASLHAPQVTIGVLFGTTLLFLLSIFFLGDFALKGSRVSPESILKTSLPEQFEVEHAFSSQQGDTLQLIDRQNEIRLILAASSKGPNDLNQLFEGVFSYQTKKDKSAQFLTRFTAAHLTLKRLRSDRKSEIFSNVPFQFFSEGDEAQFAVGVFRILDRSWVAIVQHPERPFTEKAIQDSLGSLFPL